MIAPSKYKFSVTYEAPFCDVVSESPSMDKTLVKARAFFETKKEAEFFMHNLENEEGFVNVKLTDR